MQLEQSTIFTELLDLPHILTNTMSILFIVGCFFVAMATDKVKAWLEKTTNKKFNRSVNKNAQVNNDLAGLRALYDADRVLLYQIHNGQYYFSGEGADKLSLTNFVLNAGIAVPSDLSSKHANILTSHWPDTFMHMEKEGCFHTSVEDAKDKVFAQTMALDGTKDVILAPVKDSRGMWRGVLVLCYLSPCENVEYGDLKKYSVSIGDLLGS